MFIRWRDVEQNCVELDDTTAKEVGDVRKEGRDVLGPALIDGCPRIGPDEQRTVAEVTGHLGRQVRPRPLGMQVDYSDVLELERARHERVQQDRRCRGSPVEVNLLAGGDAGDRLGGGGDAHATTLCFVGQATCLSALFKTT